MCADLTLSYHSFPFYPTNNLTTLSNMVSGIIVVNKSSAPISVFVSKYSNSKGDDSWFTLGPGASDTWGRSGWELVAFKNHDDSDRAGVYVHANHAVTFNSLHSITIA
ncbi:hypothetical protein C8Q79DRAFT_780337 [Trametes meyenii]|nr:hypothetical protein C8Q79DRAFT_780337 [Trametes meyenii]